MTRSRFLPFAALGALFLLSALPAQAQTNAVDNPECLGSSCGRPKEEGGGCGCGCGSVWVAYTDDGVTLAYTDDADGDGKADDRDNCPFASNREQVDADGDSVGIRPEGLGLAQYGLFTVMEVLPFLAAVLILSPKLRFGLPTYAITAACLLIIPFIRVGEAYDFMMRVSIPALAILSVMLADALSGQRMSRLPPLRRMAALLACVILAIGMVTPLLELRRAFAFLPPPLTRCNLVNSMRQVTGLEQTSGATYFASIEKVPAPIRPRNPLLVREQAGPPCWTRPWQSRA